MFYFTIPVIAFTAQGTGDGKGGESQEYNEAQGILAPQNLRCHSRCHLTTAYGDEAQGPSAKHGKKGSF